MVDWDFPRGVASIALLVEFAGERGIPADMVLLGSGVDLATVRDPMAQVEARQELAVVRNFLAHCADDPTELGHEVGCRYHATAYGIWGFAVTSSRTVGDAVRLALRYVELTYVFCAPELRVEGDVAALHWHTTGVPADVRPFLLARDVAASCTLIVELLGVRPDFDPDHPDNAVISLPRTLLEQRMPQANDHTAAVCEQQCRALLAERRARDGMARRVRDRLLTVDGLHTDMDTVAAELVVTTRTLRRRLAAEGTSYRALVDEVRQALAEELLATRSLSVEQVAYRLGYGDAASFVRAFTRWKGISPGRYARSRRDRAVRRA
ncbi:AraC family transcriptional regulator [Saccharomonospora sp.]|uniref:AraC family transcriptional regulator n=1 Tax=Saccharomonospora sp. TaxID=33913 RepID=UPI002625F571|nr:AraC family transcriptional regulator [Saccharomonospora sp.]